MPTRPIPTSPAIRSARARLAAVHRWHPEPSQLAAARAELAVALLGGLGDLARAIVAQTPSWTPQALQRARAVLDLRHLLDDARHDVDDDGRHDGHLDGRRDGRHEVRSGLEVDGQDGR